MDLGRYQLVDKITKDGQVAGETWPSDLTSQPRKEIKSKPVSASSIELGSLDSQKPLRDASYEESTEPFVAHPEGKGAWRARTWQLGKEASGRYRPAWFPIVISGLVLAGVVLIVNISILAWAYSRFQVQHDSAVIFTGSCGRTSTIMTAAELAINILSTLLLAASNNCGQLLISPTRMEIDRAHEKGVWIHVGIASVRNFRWIARWRVATWGILFLSSVPLHLLYNSVIYSSVHTNDWLAAAVTEDFLDGSSWNETIANATFTQRANAQYNKETNQNFLGVLSEMQNSSSGLVQLDNDKCQSAYGTNTLGSPYLNVLLITNYTSNDSFVDGLLHYPEWATNYMPWFNMTAGASWLIDGSACYEEWDYSHGSNWSLPVCVPGGPAGIDFSLERAFVQYCLAQPLSAFDAQCSISVSTTLLIVVIVCNVLKATCLLCTLLATSFHPLVTVGDAVDSFLERPDRTTVGCGPLSLSTVEDVPKKMPGFYSQRIKNWNKAFIWKHKSKGRRWGHAIGAGFGFSSVLFIFVAWFGIMATISRSWTKDIVSSWSHDVTYTTYANYQTTPEEVDPKTLVGNVLLVNTPQLAVSIICFLYNSIFTRMLISYEFSKFGHNRKFLRVTRPASSQRSTYWLQLPYRYIIPMMCGMALIHFFVSRGIYLININVYNISGQEVPYRDHFSHATSGLALLCAFLVGTLMLFAMLGCVLRTLGQGIPIFGSNSVAISSACHPTVGDEEARTKALQYGVVDAPPADGYEEDRGEMKHVCFSSFEVEPLEGGKKYY